jgi:drug/metabolite transporter (DMT)-like permease
MIDDPDYIKRRIAYVDAIQSIHPRKRTIGLFGCLIGIIVLAWSEFRDGAPRWETTAALIIIAISWALFAYVYFARTRYVRAHPFDSGS